MNLFAASTLILLCVVAPAHSAPATSSRPAEEVVPLPLPLPSAAAPKKEPEFRFWCEGTAENAADSWTVMQCNSYIDGEPVKATWAFYTPLGERLSEPVTDFGTTRPLRVPEGVSVLQTVIEMPRTIYPARMLIRLERETEFHRPRIKFEQYSAEGLRRFGVASPRAEELVRRFYDPPARYDEP